MPNPVVKDEWLQLKKCCPYLRLGSWLHHEAAWPHTQLFLKQTNLRHYYTLRWSRENAQGKQRRLQQTGTEWKGKKAFSLATVRILSISSFLKATDVQLKTIRHSRIVACSANCTGVHQGSRSDRIQEAKPEQRVTPSGQISPLLLSSRYKPKV